MAELAKVRPVRLYVSADGPRDHKPGEEARCREAREIVLQPSWPCEVITNFSDKNLGCKRAVSGGISWFFEQETEGVILEDDCLPDPSFFGFCKELLERYRQDERVMHINGTVFLQPSDLSEVSSSYFFSQIPHVWGWATWRRAWEAFDPGMRDLNSLVGDPRYRKLFLKTPHAKYWPKLFRHVMKKKVDSWATPWAYSIMSAGGLCVAPVVNLVHNIGFDGEATHTKQSSISPQTKTISDRLLHPKEVIASRYLDSLVMEKIFVKTLWQRLLRRGAGWYTAFISKWQPKLKN